MRRALGRVRLSSQKYMSVPPPTGGSPSNEASACRTCVSSAGGVVSSGVAVSAPAAKTITPRDRHAGEPRCRLRERSSSRPVNSASSSGRVRARRRARSPRASAAGQSGSRVSRRRARARAERAQPLDLRPRRAAPPCSPGRARSSGSRRPTGPPTWSVTSVAARGGGRPWRGRSTGRGERTRCRIPAPRRMVREAERHRRAVGLVRRVGPVALVLGLEQVARRIARATRPPLRRPTVSVVTRAERAARTRRPRTVAGRSGRAAAADRAVRGPARERLPGALVVGMQDAEPDPVVGELRPGRAVHAVDDRAGGAPVIVPRQASSRSDRRAWSTVKVTRSGRPPLDVAAR